jgi:drug/metabolite transporter (DMT)-like permease
MVYLIIVSVIWALSFSLIKGNLTSLDSNFVAFSRLFISFIIFLPFLRLKNIPKSLIFHFILIGIVQYGIMYSAYIYSYQYLKAYEIAILTILTPFFIVLISEIWDRKFIMWHWLAAILTIFGSAVIVYSEKITFGFWIGVALIQLSNICFAFGQVYFKNIMNKYSSVKSINIFALLYFGAILITGLFTITTIDLEIFVISSDQILTLIYLGAIASGICFFLWNIGVTKVGTATLAIINNLKIPLGVLFAFIIIGEKVNLFQFGFGFSIIILALIINEKYFKSINNLKSGK